MVPGRKTKYANISGEVDLEMAWMPLVNVPGTHYIFSVPGGIKLEITCLLAHMIIWSFFHKVSIEN